MIGRPLTKIAVKAAFVAVMVLVLIVILWPAFFVISFSLRPVEEVFGGLATWLPQQYSLSSYVHIFTSFEIEGNRFGVFVYNSLFATITASLVSMTCAFMAAYAVSRFDFRGKKLLMYMILVTQLLPGVVYLIPYYTMLLDMELLNSRTGLVLTYIIFGVAICTWMLRGYMDEVPIELDQAALIDGCTYPGIMARIILPLVAPGIVAMGLFSFILGWNDYLFASIILRTTSRWTLPVALAAFRGMYRVNWGGIMAMSVLISVPVVAFFLYIQRNVAAGITAGSIK